MKRVVFETGPLDGQNERIRIIVRDTLEEIASFGDGGRQPGQFYGVHSIASDFKGNFYTTETYEGKRVQKFVYKGIGSIPRAVVSSLRPSRTLYLGLLSRSKSCHADQRFFGKNSGAPWLGSAHE